MVSFFLLLGFLFLFAFFYLLSYLFYLIPLSAIFRMQTLDNLFLLFRGFLLFWPVIFDGFFFLLHDFGQFFSQIDPNLVGLDLGHLSKLLLVLLKQMLLLRLSKHSFDLVIFVLIVKCSSGNNRLRTADFNRFGQWFKNLFVDWFGLELF
jgi:hypothetical protein